MKTTRLFPLPLVAVLGLVATLAAPKLANAQQTNWVAFNDHRPTTTPVANGWRITAPNVTGYDMGAPGDLTASPLTDFLTGNPLVATVAFTRTGGPDDFGAIGRPIPTNTPAARIFYGVCDLSNDGLVGVRAVPPNTTESYVTATFGGLDPTKRYVFRGTIIRNGGYGTRWSVAAITADGYTDAHINGAGGPGVLTANTFPASALGPGEAAFNSGGNSEGAVVGWNDIAPLFDGTFSITCKQYTGAIPGGTASGPYGYSFGAFALTEVEVVAPTITAHPAASTTVEENRPFSLSVAASGAPLNYQWYKEGVGEIPGATFATYSVAQAQVSDSGMYYAVVFNSLARRTSTVAQITVFADTAAPTVETIFSYPTVDSLGVATLDQIIIEFNEPVMAASVSSAAAYTVSGGGNPASVIVTNERSVVLVLAFPLSEDTDYSVTLSGATDVVGNVAGSSAPTFHSWVSGIGNGLLMESYNVEDTSNLPESVIEDSDYPNNPFRRDTLRAFDTRLVFPDDNQEGYGARIRGVFIPPVSGNWRFFARTEELGVVFLNPNGTGEGGKREILRQSTENAPFNWDRLQSSLIPLRAGKAYYLEGLYKAASGADYLKVAARLAEDGVPMPVDSPNTDAPDANSLAGAIIAFPLAPRNLGGTMTIAQDVGNVTAEENHDATFSVVVDNPSGLPLSYEWSRDGSPIVGAPNTPTYTFQVTSADHNAMFSVKVAKVGDQLTSGSGRLTVVPDTTGPEIVEVVSPGLTNIIVRYSERVDLVTATDPINYQVTGPSAFGVIGVVLGSDNSTVTLSAAEGETLIAGETYQLRVEAVEDLGFRPIVPNPTLVSFIAGSTAPVLSIRRSGSQVVLTWPVSATGYVLEQASAFASPPNTTAWTAVGIPPTVINGRNNVTVAVGQGNKVFRLRR
jgi:hypothetical protein